MVGNRTKWTLAAVVAAAALFAACGGSSEAETHGADIAAEPVRTVAAEQPGTSSSLCLVCHSQEGVTVKTGLSEQHRLEAVAPDGYYTSAHNDMPCVECHQEQSSLPHDKFTPSGEPIVRTVDSSAVCETCHAGAFEGFLDSVHGKVTRFGDERAPGCIDCHSTHYVQPVKTWTASAKATACSGCHKGADATFAGALIHVEPTPGRLPVDFLATRFFGALVVAVVGIGILHVELDILRWLKGKVSRRKRGDKGR